VRSSSHRARVRILVTGRVQGVGFRYFAATRARALGLHGYARNLPGGQVEVVAEGPRGDLDKLLDGLRYGPPGADVRGLQTDWAEAPAGEGEFVIR
jgi:acylphosphatase